MKKKKALCETMTQSKLLFSDKFLLPNYNTKTSNKFAAKYLVPCNRTNFINFQYFSDKVFKSFYTSVKQTKSYAHR